MRLKAILIAGALALAAAGDAEAQFSLDFTGLYGTAISGTTIQGITFDYVRGGITSTSVGGGTICTSYLCGESIQGITGNAALSMSFANPVDYFRFGLLGYGTTSSYVSLAFYDPFGASLGTQDMFLYSPTTNAYAEGLFEWNGPALGSIVIDLDYDPNMAWRFGLDNIEGQIADVIIAEDPTGGGGPTNTVTPEPISMVLLGTGLAGIGGVARRRRQSQDLG